MIVSCEERLLSIGSECLDSIPPACICVYQFFESAKNFCCALVLYFDYISMSACVLYRKEEDVCSDIYEIHM